MTLSSDGRYHYLLGELRGLDLVKLRCRVHALLPLLGDRQRFDGETVDASHERLVDLGARHVVRAELVASYRVPEERVSGERVVARIRLVRRAAGG